MTPLQYIINQKYWYIRTIEHDCNKMARIYDDEQRKEIHRLINEGYLPIMSVAGKGRCTRKHWSVEEYQGKHGNGYKMITSYPPSKSLNTITYFLKIA